MPAPSNRIGLSLPAALAALALAAPALAAEALVGATLIDGRGGEAVEDAVVLVGGERIACAGTRTQCPVPAGARVHDLTGRYVTPGLIDAHVHFSQTGWIDGRPDALEPEDRPAYEATVAQLRADPGRWHRAYLCSGVTSVFDVGGAPWSVSDRRTDPAPRSERVNSRAAGPLLFAFAEQMNAVFGPGTLADQPVFLPLTSATQVRSDVAQLVALGADAVKVWFLTPAPEDRARLEALLREAGTAARAAGLPLIVHADGLAEAKAALRAGAAMLVHSVSEAPVDREFLDLLIEQDTFYAPTLQVYRNWSLTAFAQAAGEAAPLSDPNRCVDEAVRAKIAAPAGAEPDRAALMKEAEDLLETGRADAVMAANLRAVRDAGGRIVLGTDAGNPLTLHGAAINGELEAMQAAGMRPGEIMQAAWPQAAAALGMAQEIGTLEAGKLADLLVLAEDPREDVAAFRALTHVMRAGVLRSQEELQVR